MDLNLHLWTIPALCFSGFLLNLLFGRLWSRTAAAIVGVGVVGAAFLDALWVVSHWGSFVAPYLEIHRPWIQTGSLYIPFGFQLDQLSLVMLLIVTGVGFLIHLYSAGYMAHEGGFYRYFALLNLFMFFMLVLVLANNYLLMFIGWEGVGFASYMLIGFFFRRDSAASAGMKAFVVNRIGDFGFLLGLFLIFNHFGTFEFTRVFSQVKQLPVEAAWHWAGPLTIIALMLFVGATGKSAQIPLYVWLPDAMEGPTPVSALIHAATMVTAGVYMVCRSATIYDRAPFAGSVVLAIGALTALFAASIGLVQRDIKKVLAYSTVSQLGYMFMACGAMAYGAGVFHLMTHAFFKGLLFLGAGSVIHAMNGEQDMFRIQQMAPGGLRRYAPITFWTFVVATCAIAGIPGFSGFFSKDLILYSVLSGGNTLWWAVGTLAALLTSFYMFRAVFVTFFGEGEKSVHSAHPTGRESASVHDVAHDHETTGMAHAEGHGVPHESPLTMTLPLMILALLALGGGWVGIGDRFGHFLDPVFDTGVPRAAVSGITEGTVTLISVVMGLLGLAVAWFLYLRSKGTADKLAAAFSGLHRTLTNKYWVDEFYRAVIVVPLTAIARYILWKGVDSGLIDGVVNGVGGASQALSGGLRRQASGNLRSYASWIGAGAVLALLYVIVAGR